MLTALGTIGAGAQQYDRGYETKTDNVFVPKGTWMLGGTVRYSQHINQNYPFLIIDDINSTGYTISARPKLLYMFHDNMGAGLTFSYDRSMLDLSTANLSISEISMSAEDYYQLQHTYSAHAFFRAYIPLGQSKRVAMFADLLLGGSFKQGKVYNAGGSSVVGSYEQSYKIDLSVNPGIAAFLTDRLALEVNVGIIGLSYKWTDQIHNQVSTGDTDSASAGFSLNLLSLGVGISYYFF